MSPDTIAMVQSTIGMGHKRSHYRHDAFWPAVNSLHWTNKICHPQCDPLCFRSKQTTVAVRPHHTLPSKQTNRPISNSKLVPLCRSPTMCIRNECQDFYFFHEPKPIWKQVNLDVGWVHNMLEIYISRSTNLTLTDKSNGIGPGILIISCSLSRSYNPIILSIMNSPGIRITWFPFKNDSVLLARSTHKKFFDWWISSMRICRDPIGMVVISK